MSSTARESASTAPPISLRRRCINHLVTAAAASAVILVLLPLLAVFGYLVYNAIAGSVLILGIGSVVGVPIGIGAGIYLAEFGQNRLGDLIRFTADVLNGV